MEFQRLLEEERKIVAECRDTVAQWEKFRDDYEALHQRLTTLPNRLKHDVMVPMGKHAFIPGQLYHTNEITVLLGDNWFAQVTAKQAQDIVSRRQKVVEEKLSDARRQLKDIEAKVAFTTACQQQDTVEIKEELQGNNIPASKKRIAHTKKTPPVVKETPPVVKATEKKAQEDSDAELWKRLDELECQEEEKPEQDEDDTNSIAATFVVNERETTVINISHTSLLMPESTSNKTHTPSCTINSPADICKSSPVDSAVEPPDEPVVVPKSVHWSSDVTSPPQPSPEIHTNTPTADPRLKPFTGSVVEKESSLTTSSTDSARKVSRFKASRQT